MQAGFFKGVEMEWISVKDELPKLSYLESDNADDPYECYPVFVKSDERNVFCVAYLVREQDHDKWDFGEISWELYIPGNGGDILHRDFETFTHWMELPEGPCDSLFSKQTKYFCEYCEESKKQDEISGFICKECME